MAPYSIFDAELDRWAAKVGLAWTHKYKDEEVRSVDIDIGLPRKAQIWIEPARDGSSIAVRAWDRRAQRLSEITTPSQLHATLDRVWLLVRAWKEL